MSIVAVRCSRLRARVRVGGLCTSASVLMWFAATASAQIDAEYPDEFENIGVESRLDETVPLRLTFTGGDGESVTLGELIDGKPTILTLNYYDCPTLCTFQLNGLVDALKQMKWTLGEEFNVVTVSFDPTEGPELAEVKQRGYMSVYNREGADGGWRFHVADEENIRALTEAVGFKYAFDEKSGEWMHTSTLVFLTPEGRISLYMNGVKFNARDIRFALVDASNGKVGSFADDFLLFTCFRYDPDADSFVPSAFLMVRTGGVLTLLVMAVGAFVLWRRTPKIHAVDEMPTSDGRSTPAMEGPNA